ncbi:DUF6542 domain-containing protein [Kitasatospora sp. NPDC052896]|uniref:DUF6542 domain-containing protein n=1 Tax=Kitasatospora sp. NPDC052896 TaxID=3364061 RepID=UPI0037C74C86
MAEQWAVTPSEGIDLWRDQPEPPPPPARGSDDRPDESRPGPLSRGGRPAARPQRQGGLIALLLLGLPLVGALVDEAVAPGLGLIFDSCAVLGTAGAAALAERSGWWWVLPASPTVVLATTAAAELLGDSAKYQGSKALATGAARWTINDFPVMLAALGAALLVVLVRIARDRRTRDGRNRRG